MEIDELDELLEGDKLTDQTENELELYRQKRILEMKAKAMKNRFQGLTEIVKDEWLKEVTEGSKSCSVVVHLYQNSLIECQLMDEALTSLSNKFKYVKFLRIKYDQAIENWPERNLPTLFVYEKGALKSQLITANSIGGKQMTSDGKQYLISCFEGTIIALIQGFQC